MLLIVVGGVMSVKMAKEDIVIRWLLLSVCIIIDNDNPDEFAVEGLR